MASKATNPVSDQYNSDTVNEIAKLIDTQPNGPVFTLRLLAHKIKSPHEREALSSLAVRIRIFLLVSVVGISV
ncbi:unnamed protein product [Trichobilharzia regenti]|nr:unnamed protein product [Trichobilharzia regenti]